MLTRSITSPPCPHKPRTSAVPRLARSRTTGRRSVSPSASWIPWVKSVSVATSPCWPSYPIQYTVYASRICWWQRASIATIFLNAIDGRTMLYYTSQTAGGIYHYLLESSCPPRLRMVPQRKHLTRGGGEAGEEEVRGACVDYRGDDRPGGYLCWNRSVPGFTWRNQPGA